jgi:nucleoside phosphorylase
MTTPSARRQVVVLAPMPLEMHAITSAFGLTRTSPTRGAPWTGHIGNSDVTALHIGMGPPLTRVATARLFDATAPDYVPVDHVMVAGICGGLDPDLPVGTLLNAEYIIDATNGTEYRHTPPGDEPLAGKIITTEGATLDIELSRAFRARGCLGVDMENSAVAEVCEANGCPWSVYRCIGDRWFDGLLDQRVLNVTNPDGSGNQDALSRLLAAEPDVAAKLEQLSRDPTRAARLAAEAAVRGCLALGD